MSNKTILYYTCNKINEKFASKVKDQIKWANKNLNYPIISISQKPLTDMGTNICVGDIGQSLQNIYRQILEGAKLATTDYIVCCEDDTLYTEEHLIVTPKTFAYNLNRWNLHEHNNVYSYRRRVVMSQCVAHRETLIKCLEERFKLPEIPKKYCGEPGMFEKDLGLSEIPYDTFVTKEPTLVIAHKDNTTGKKLQGKDAPIRQDLAPWGNGKALLDNIYRVNGHKVEAQKVVLPRLKRSQYSYIKSKVFC